MSQVHPVDRSFPLTTWRLLPLRILENVGLPIDAM